MNALGWEQLAFVAAATAILAPLVGKYLAATFRDRGPGDRPAPGTGSSCPWNGWCTGRCG